MSTLVRIPSPLRSATNGLARVSLEGNTVGQLLHNLEDRFPGVLGQLLDESGNLRRFVNIYLNGEDIGYLNGLDTNAEENGEVSIVPAVAGGCPH
ncbi:MAG: MoaD/ThiS family protein [Chloroflexi bacterium]|nr:MoaD/ThiS family protein [Chloroflexota bacterium]